MLFLCTWPRNRLLEVERRYRTQFITGIINGHFDSVNNLIERARGFGWDFSMPHVVALLEVDFFNRSHKTSYGSQGYQQQKEQALEITKNGFHKYYVGGQSVVVDYGRHILVLILDRDATSIPKYVLKKTKATIKQVIEDLKFSMSCLTVSAGISRIQKSLLTWEQVTRKRSKPYYFYKQCGIMIL